MSKVYVPPDITQTEHRGTLDRVVFSDDSQPFVIAALTDGASVCGPALADSLARGVIYRFLGAWTPDPKYGYRFRFSTFLVHAASSKAGVAKYLESICDGFPKRLFNKLWAAYGDESITRLRDDPVSVAVDISAPPELCSEASDALKRDRRYADTKVTLFQLLDKRGFPSRIYSELLDAWGDTAPDRIRANPFDMLGKFSGAGFRRCDRLWSDLGLPKDSLARGVACASHLLLDGGGAGHTWLSAVSLAERLREVAPGCDPVETFKAAIDQGKVKKHRDAAGELWLAAYPRAAAEERIAASVARLTAHGPTLWPTDRVRVGPAGKPSEHQVERLRRATILPIGLLLGSPGTGKTTSVSYLLREVVRDFGLDSVRLVAPTGKAAVRMTQAIKLAGLDLRATTIHRLLEIGRNGHDGDGWGFKRNRGNPLDCKFLVVDETSMCDTNLLADLLDAVPNGGHVLLVGDPGQLPPVGHGAPLRDLIDAGGPAGELTQVQRNAGSIVHACLRIKNGESFEIPDEIDLQAETPKNLMLREARDGAHAVEVLCNLIRDGQGGAGGGPGGRVFGFDPVWQTQVIVARNAKGDISRKALNAKLHPMLNPDGYSASGNPFKVGDKIICLRNSHMQRVTYLYGTGGETADKLDAISSVDTASTRMMWDSELYQTVRDDIANKPAEVYVANGEIGRVIAVSKSLTIARFSEADELIKIPMGKKRDDDEEEDGGESGSGGEGGGEKGQGCNFDLAYAITVHRAQGSEWPCVVVPADPQGGMIADKNWWYTAISRAAKLCVIVGSLATVDKQRMKTGLARRKTFLREQVQAVLWRDL